ncbi:MAG TPA: MlaD family protein [Casimicrobiaceae bacterium]|nr:MlaD family protein [Casimicrobiaceae bacterium]
METDKHYFFEGLFILVFAAGAALFFVWVANTGHGDDIVYRIHFNESVSGLALGDPVKFRGVDVGTVKSMALDTSDPRQVQVDVRLRKDTPVKTDTKAVLKLKGITGVVFIELSGGSPDAQQLAAVTPEGRIPEIPSEKSSLNAFLDELPKVLEKFAKLEDKANKVVGDVGGLTSKIKENPSVLVWGQKGKDKENSSLQKNSMARNRTGETALTQ